MVRHSPGTVSTRRRSVAGAVVALGILPAFAAIGMAEEFEFRGTVIERQEGHYLVLKNANVRSQPRTGSKRLGKLESMSRVETVGGPPGTAWLAVRKDGKDLGFVYAPLLVPLVDGRLDADLTGTILVPDGPRCEFVVRYGGKGEMYGAPFQTFDYDVHWRCIGVGEPLEFYSFMFITEGPFAISQTPLYQISVEVPRIAGDYDDVLSTIILYRKDKAKLSFDRVTLKGYRSASPKKTATAESVTDALLGALEIAATSWNKRVWKELRGTIE